ncbi:MAG: hypothetical protein QXP36_06205 [Conexivisphaerales archaeon]
MTNMRNTDDFFEHVFVVGNFEIARDPFSSGFRFFENNFGIKRSISIEEFLKSVPFSSHFYKDILNLNNVLWFTKNDIGNDVYRYPFFDNLQVLNVRLLGNMLSLDIVADLSMFSLFEMPTFFNVKEFAFTLFLDKEGIVGVQDRGYRDVNQKSGLHTTLLFGNRIFDPLLLDNKTLDPGEGKHSLPEKIRFTHRLYPLDDGVFFSMFGSPFNIVVPYSALTRSKKVPLQSYYVWDVTHLQKEYVDFEKALFNDVTGACLSPFSVGFVTTDGRYINVKEVVENSSLPEEHKQKLSQLVDKMFIFEESGDFRVYGSARDYFLFYDRARSVATILGTDIDNAESGFFLEFSVTPNSIQVKDYAVVDNGKSKLLHANNSLDKFCLFSNLRTSVVRSAVFSSDFYYAFATRLFEKRHSESLSNFVGKLSQYYWLDYFKVPNGPFYKEYVLGIVKDEITYDHKNALPIVSTVIYEVERGDNKEITALIPECEYKGIAILRDREGDFHAYKLSFDVEESSGLIDLNKGFKWIKYDKTFSSYMDLVRHTQVVYRSEGSGLFSRKYRTFVLEGDFFDNSKLYHVPAKSFMKGYADFPALTSSLDAFTKEMIVDWIDKHYINRSMDSELER